MDIAKAMEARAERVLVDIAQPKTDRSSDFAQKLAGLARAAPITSGAAVAVDSEPELQQPVQRRKASFDSVMDVDRLTAEHLVYSGDDMFKRTCEQNPGEYEDFCEVVRKVGGADAFYQLFVTNYDEQPAHGRGGKQFAGNLKNHIPSELTPVEKCAQVFVGMYGVRRKGLRSNVAFQEIVLELQARQQAGVVAPVRGRFGSSS